MTVSNSALSESSSLMRLELHALRKEYPGIVACNDVSLQVRVGEIHALLGENGAGKSTLVKMIYGVTPPTSGRIMWEGQAVHFANPAQARAHGVGMVFQHFSLFDSLRVVENVALALPGRLNLRRLARRIATVSEHYGLPVDPQRPVASLSVGERQRVEIVRCLLQEPRLLIMDEPTSVLTPLAIDRLFTTLRTLAAEGCSVLYISHKLDEIQSLCHHATVLRAGRVTGECRPSEETTASLARMMIGRDLPVFERRAATTASEVCLQLNHLSLLPRDPYGTPLHDLQLSVRAGEIVGIAGVSGNGQMELLRVLSGEQRLAKAEALMLCARAAGRMTPMERRRLGMALVPEERLGRGAVPDLTLTDNAMLTQSWARHLVRYGLIRFGRARHFAKRCIDGFNVQCGGTESVAGSLSGGNLQKFIVGRELLQEPRVVVCAQPTWGVDVGAAAFIRQSLLDLRAKGCAVLVISEELEELFAICDRIAVMAEGRLSPVVAVEATSAEAIGLWMSGLWPGSVKSAQSTGSTGSTTDAVVPLEASTSAGQGGAHVG